MSTEAATEITAAPTTEAAAAPIAAPATMGLIARLIDFSARKRFIVFLLAGVLSLWGLWSAQRSHQTQLRAGPVT